MTKLKKLYHYIRSPLHKKLWQTWVKMFTQLWSADRFGRITWRTMWCLLRRNDFFLKNHMTRLLLTHSSKGLYWSCQEIWQVPKPCQYPTPTYQWLEIYSKSLVIFKLGFRHSWDVTSCTNSKEVFNYDLQLFFKMEISWAISHDTRKCCLKFFLA